MTRVAILGGSVAGLYAALVLAQDGHDVTVYERDAPPPPDPDEAFHRWDRPGTPHLRQSHAFLARAVAVMSADAPELYAALLAAGVHVVRSADFLPPWVADRAPRPGDDEVRTLSARRPVFDWVLHTYAAAAGVRVARTGATGFVLADGGAVPHVTGVRLGTGETVAADVVVDATGRRTRTPQWLAEAGVTLPGDGASPCGNRYYTRYFALLPGVPAPPLMRGFATTVDLDACSVLLFRGDNDTFSVSIQTEQGDDALRDLRDPRAFTAAARVVPPIADWLGPDVSQPITEPAVMTGLANTVRRTVADGRPVVTGLLLLGDAAATSNPAFGRGVAQALVGTTILRAALAHAEPDAQALAMDDGLLREVAPFVENSRELDGRTNARWRHVIAGEPLPEPPAELVFEDVLTAAMRDRDVFDAFARTMGLLRTPDSVLADPVLRERVAATKAEGWLPPFPPMPSRADLLAAMAAATA